MNPMAYRGMADFATEVALTGRFFNAGAALAAGVINRVALAGKYIDAARAFVHKRAPKPFKAR